MLEGDMLEVCVEFEVGDEANGSATLIQILGDAGTDAFLSASGDGTSTVYCTAFNSDIFIDCVPVTENLDVTLFCLQTAEPFFNNTFSTTVYPFLDKFSYEVTPAVNNCPNAPVYPQIVSTGECELDIFDVITVDPSDGCPPTPGMNVCLQKLPQQLSLYQLVILAMELVKMKFQVQLFRQWIVQQAVLRLLYMML